VTTVAIMQPTYLPWLGYFDMLDQADVFVLLDTVAINRKSWQTRNRIRGRDGNAVWLSVPTSAHQGQPLCDVEIAPSAWAAKHIRTIENAYAQAPFLDFLSPVLDGIRYPWSYLAGMTFDLIWELADQLGIGHRICRASTSIGGVISDDPYRRIKDICSYFDATELLNTTGAKDWMEGHDIGVPVRWHDYQHPTYTQGNAPFMFHLSVVDLLAWHGPDSLDIIRSGRR